MSCFSYLRGRKEDATQKGINKEVDNNLGALMFTMAELIEVSENFSESHKIGVGVFGTVYQGKFRDGSTIAMKRARQELVEESFERKVFKDFQKEVVMLSQVEHLNLVRLIGYLEQMNERIVVTEYVPNGNLRQHLDGEPP